MATSLPKKKKNLASISTGGDTIEMALANFSLPTELSCIEVNYPVLIERRNKANWNEILEESANYQQTLAEHNNRYMEPATPTHFRKTEPDYIHDEVLVYLMPAIVEALNKAKIWEAFEVQKCFFNGLDHIVQELWNNNPRHPIRKENNLHIFNMPWVRRYLLKHPRPIYPKSWLWPEEYAATYIQKTVRQYNVQKDREVQEMRDFWRKLKLEAKYSSLVCNPHLLKMMAAGDDPTYKDN